MLIYLKKNVYWQGKQVLSLTHCYNYGILVFKWRRTLTFLNNKICSTGSIAHVWKLLQNLEQINNIFFVIQKH
jgi:hypothetical protein